MTSVSAWTLVVQSASRAADRLCRTPPFVPTPPLRLDACTCFLSPAPASTTASSSLSQKPRRDQRLNLL